VIPVTVVLLVICKSAHLVLILWMVTAMKLAAIALVVVCVTTDLVYAIAFLGSLVPDASTRPLWCKLFAGGTKIEVSIVLYSMCFSLQIN